jgi:hypothetical protein
MCHHVDEALSWEELKERHRSDAADDRADEPTAPDDRVEEPTEIDEPEPRAPADD